jgi:hypothetical protein
MADARITLAKQGGTNSCLYGGSNFGCGTLFKITPSWTFLLWQTMLLIPAGEPLQTHACFCKS